MLIANGQEEMGIEASLKLLDLSPDASLDAAGQAYEHMQQLIDQYHQDSGGADPQARQADLELLSLAYEKVVAHISERSAPQTAGREAKPLLRVVSDQKTLADLDFPMDLSDLEAPSRDNESLPVLPESDIQTVEAALSIISRRLNEAEAALPEAQQVVDAATAAVEAANRRHERIRQESINAIVAAKSAKIRALLLEIEAKRSIEKAMAVAEKARERVKAAKRMAKDAMTEADKAQQQVGELKQSEEEAAAEAVKAEKQLEQAKTRLKTLTNRLVETRKRIKISRDNGGELTFHPDGRPGGDYLDAILADRLTLSDANSDNAGDQEKILADLREIEASLQGSEVPAKPSPAAGIKASSNKRHVPERRRQPRISYPTHLRPVLSVDGRTVPIIDLSGSSMGLKTDGNYACPRIVRGMIDFPDRPSVNITGRVVRENGTTTGLKLVTRIGKHILNAEQRRLRA
ncbi:PilZ domain-containing protein [Desulfosarcina cetonica]